MTIPLHAIPLPTTTSLHAIPYSRLSIAEERQRRASEAGQRTNPCPHCGEWSIVETVTRNRPGLPAVVQTISRCQRNPRWREERCPLTILHEGWAPDPPDDTADDQAPAESLREALRESLREALRDERPQAKAEAEEEESMPERTCETCGADIAHRGVRANMCAPCAAAKKVERDREHNQRMNEQRKRKRNVQAPHPQPQAIEPDTPPQNVPRPVPSALRVSVLDLAQRAVEGASIRATMRAILALSSERQDLLRRLLDDVEAA